jgi:hypothetical protein
MERSASRRAVRTTEQHATLLSDYALAALVKTAAALESLLVIGREPTTRALAERSAFLLSDNPDQRQKISVGAQRFYSIRGDVVH